jgi:hypothetical protein
MSALKDETAVKRFLSFSSSVSLEVPSRLSQHAPPTPPS